MTTYFTSKGGATELTDPPMARGGEGTIHRLTNDPTQLAKIFHTRNNTPALRAKLEYMVQHPPPLNLQGKTPDVAWPTELLRDRQGQVVGYLMPFIQGTKQLSQVYNPASTRFLTWKHALLMCANLARIIEILHASGYVIGDLSPANVLAHATAHITLVDCDTMQITEPRTGRVHLSTATSPEVRPPEFAGNVSLAKLVRSHHSDNHVAAILYWNLLMQGRAPFVEGGTDMEAGVFKNSWLFKPENQLHPRYPKPSWLPRELRTLFSLVFGLGLTQPEVRPEAATWKRYFKAAYDQLVQCPRSRYHHFSPHNAVCPWCAQLGHHTPYHPPPATRSLSPPTPQTALTTSAWSGAPLPHTRPRMTPLQRFDDDLDRLLEPLYQVFNARSTFEKGAVQSLLIIVAVLTVVFLFSLGAKMSQPSQTAPNGSQPLSITQITSDTTPPATSETAAATPISETEIVTRASNPRRDSAQASSQNSPQDRAASDPLPDPVGATSASADTFQVPDPIGFGNEDSGSLPALAGWLCEGDLDLGLNGEIRLHDDIAETGQILITTPGHETKIYTPFGASCQPFATGDEKGFVSAHVAGMHQGGCGTGCARVHVYHVSGQRILSANWQ